MRIGVRHLLSVPCTLALLLAVGALGASSALAAGDANMASCPASTEASPGFRAYLADCRAYELVSPPYKEGAPLETVSKVSEDGLHVILGSFGSFAGSVGTSSPFEANIIELSRTGSGWAPFPLDPPTSQFSGSAFVDASADLSRTLWFLHTPSQSVFVHDFYLRDSDGAFTEIGPGVPPSATEGPTGPEMESAGISVPEYHGASANLDHIVYSIASVMPGFLWPGDETLEGGFAKSLYEYSGVDNTEPVLVGVSNPEVLHGSPHVNDGAVLISRCGTLLGSEHSAYNAISEDGERVFFTPQGKDSRSCAGAQPALQEVYVREGGSHTILLSGQSPSGCTGGCATSTPRDANFEGASSDGSKAFFTSTQQLLNGAIEDSTIGDSAFKGCSETTGVGGCNLYEYDFGNEAGHSLVLVSGGDPAGAQVQGVARISRDGSHVYFVAKGVLTSEPDFSLPAGHQVAVAGEDNLYVFERDSRFPAGHTSFIATLSTEDRRDWSQGDFRPVEATPDGRFLIFPSHAHLTPDDQSSPEAVQLFEYDAQEGRLARISIGQRAPEGYFCPASETMEEGYNCDGNIETAADNPTFGFEGLFEEGLHFSNLDRPGEEASSVAVSRDGSRVVFESPDDLAPQAVSGQQPGCMSIYEYKSSGPIGNGNVYLISDGKDLSVRASRCGARYTRMDSSGEDVFFETGDPLVPQDTDTQGDLYDARIGGGFAAPVSPVGCMGDSCQGPLGAPLTLAAAGSATQPGGGNLAPPPASKPKPKPKSLTRAQKLAKALKACRRKPKRKRPACKTQARRAYGPVKAKKSRNGGK